MTKKTLTRIVREFETLKDGSVVKRVKILPAQPREPVTCPTCGRRKLLSVGQIWNCKHKD